ncbi:MAG: hypothetical protein WCS65_04010, partial [Verrucomicrobiae bacterium]
TGAATTTGDSYVSSGGDARSPVLSTGSCQISNYDDPPNLKNDEPGTIDFSTSLSSENTTAMMLANGKKKLGEFQGTLQPGTPFAYRNVHDNELAFDYQKVQFKFKWKPDVTAEQKHEVRYLVLFQPENNPDTEEDESLTKAETVGTITWDGKEAESELFTIDPDIKNPEKDGAYSLLAMDLAVDANRDGVVEFGADRTSAESPFRFWVNDDQDSSFGTTEGENFIDGEVTPVCVPDCNNNQIEAKRDLEDFTRLWIHIGAFYQELQNANGKLQVGLKWKNTSGASPAIKVYSSADPDGATSYLTNDTAAGAQIVPGINTTTGYGVSLGEVKESGEPFIFKKEFWAGYSESNPKKCLIFEGSGEGKGQLCLTILDGDGKEFGEGPGVWLDLKDIKKMYQSSDGDMFAGAPPGEAEQTVVSVHGWNMSQDGSRNYAETMFKRLWHRGFKGRFAYFRWNTYWITATDVIGTLTTQYFANYNNSEYIAWTQGAPALKSFVESLPYESKNIAGHSMGNIVVGEAMRLGMQVSNYALMQPAVPAACYDEREVLKQTSTYQHSFLGVNVTMWDEASPDDDPDASTRNMAYPGMLKDIGQNGNLVLFYLPNDAATSYAWELNNDLTKPSGTLSGQFRYDRNAQPGQKLYRDFGGGLHEYSWTSRRESASFACRTWGKAAGADGRTQGSISEAGRVDLSGPTFALPGETEPGFGDEHSGQFTVRIQSLKTFYDTLMDELQLPRNP